MSRGRLRVMAYGLRHLRQAPDLAALQAAESPEELARLALIPAGRNLGIAVGLLPAEMRAEAAAALLACRVLDAYEDLSDRPVASRAVMAAVDYLTGVSDTPPPALAAVAGRDSEAVDLVLAARIHDIRALLSVLPAERRERAGQMLGDVGAVMARNLDSPMPRTAYGERVLGRVVQYACAVVTEKACTGPDLAELAGCIGVVAQSANDLRDGELCAVRRPRPRGTRSGGDAPVAGAGAGRLRAADAAGSTHPEPGCPDGDRLHDDHDGRVPVRSRRGTHAITGAGYGSARPCWPPPHRRCGPRWSRGCGTPPTGRSVDCSIRRQPCFAEIGNGDAANVAR